MNWIGSALGVAGGILWYLSGSGIFKPITFAGVITCFIFYGYDKMEEHGQRYQATLLNGVFRGL